MTQVGDGSHHLTGLCLIIDDGRAANLEIPALPAEREEQQQQGEKSPDFLKSRLS
jgi:hypothetical protein